MRIRIVNSLKGSTKEWNPKKSDYTDSQWRSACLMPDVGEGKLPVKEPDGTINENGVRSAAKMIGHVKGASAEEKKRAAKKLVSLLRKQGDEPSDALLELAGSKSQKASESAMSGEKDPGNIENSFDWIRGKLQSSAYKLEETVYKELGQYPYYWIKDIFPDTVIIEDEDTRELYKASWSIDSLTGETSIGELSGVTLAHVQKLRAEKSVSMFARDGLMSPIVGKNEAQQLAYGVVLVPGEPDSDNDVLTEEDIAPRAHKFLVKHRYVDYMHEVGDNVADVVESYISPSEMDVEVAGEMMVVPKGAWIMAVKVSDDYWPKVTSGEIKGFSIMAVNQEDLESVGGTLKPSEKSVAVKSAVAELAAASKRVTLKDLDNDWEIPAVSMVDDPAVGKALFFSLKSRSPITTPERGPEASVGREKASLARKAVETILAAKKPNGGADSIPADEDETSNEAAITQKGLRIMSAENSEEQVLTLDSLTQALKGALVEAGVAKGEPTVEEQMAAAVEKALGPLNERLDALETASKAEPVVADEPADPEANVAEGAQKSEGSGDSSSDGDAEDGRTPMEKMTDRIKALEKRNQKLERAVVSSKGLEDAGADVLEDPQYDDDDRDPFGRRIREES